MSIFILDSFLVNKFYSNNLMEILKEKIGNFCDQDKYRADQSHFLISFRCKFKNN